MISQSHVIWANEKQVAAKVIDGEAVLINLATGMYYSMEASGCFIWTLIERRQSVADIACAVAGRYEVDVEKAAQDVLRLSQELCDEGLLLSSTTAETTPAAPRSSESRLPYEEPRLEKFSDMSEMFALDPPLPGLSYTTSDTHEAGE